MPAAKLDEILSALDTVPADALESELRMLQRRVALLEAAVAYRNRDAHPQTPHTIERVYVNSAQRTLDEDTSDDDGASATSNGRPSKRQAVLRLLGETPNRSTKASAIKRRLIERGWLDDTPEAAHSLGVTLSKMFKRGELSHPKTGYYKITEAGIQARAEP